VVRGATDGRCYFIQEICGTLKKNCRLLFPSFIGFNLKVETANSSKYAALGTSNHFRYIKVKIKLSLFRSFTFPEVSRRLWLPDL